MVALGLCGMLALGICYLRLGKARRKLMEMDTQEGLQSDPLSDGASFKSSALDDDSDSDSEDKTDKKMLVAETIPTPRGRSEVFEQLADRMSRKDSITSAMSQDESPDRERRESIAIKTQQDWLSAAMGDIEDWSERSSSNASERESQPERPITPPADRPATPPAGALV